MIKTQLGGKFGKDDDGLFKLKKQLIKSGIKVVYPQGEGIVTVQNGIALTFDPKKTKKSFYDTEIDYLFTVKNNPLHIIHNKYQEQIGYIGESASIEMAYALVHDKPVVLLYLPVFSNKVPWKIKNIILSKLDKVAVQRIDLLTRAGLKRFLIKVIDDFEKYGLTANQESTVLHEVAKLLKKYKTAL